MISKLLSLYLLCCLSFSGPIFAQQAKVYMHMKGNLGNNIRVNADIERNGSKMEGSYSYNLYVDDSLLHLSPIITLYGDIDKHNKVVLRKISGSDIALTGLFSDHRFSGSWHGPDSTVLPFDIKESYTPGSLPMKIFYLHSGKDLFHGAEGTPSAEIELALLYPETGLPVPQKVVDSVKKCIQRQFFGEVKPEALPENLMKRSEQNFYRRFGEINSRWKTNRTEGFNLEKRETMSVLFNGYNLLCLQYEKRGYAGRGNPMQHFSYDLIDLRTGKKLKLTDIFKPGTENTLRKLVNKKIRENNGLDDSASLKKIGFFSDNVPLSNNIRFNGNGIYLVYNVYDVAPPALGLQKVFLPFGEIRGVIRPSCLLFSLDR